MNKYYDERLNKLESLKKLGVEPFAYGFQQASRIKDVVAESQRSPDRSVGAEYVEGKIVTVAGRIIAIRGHGKAAFADIRDWTGKIQLYIKKDKISQQDYSVFELLDIGDIIGVKGGVFKTKTGEITVLVDSLTLLTKSLLPLPEKWHGLKDVELRYRQRYVDLISNPEVMATFLKRTRIVAAVRRYLDSRDFVEVETPMMQPIPGGATARPFITHHNALDMDLYLRIAPELYLKRLLVGGMERVYEINRNFRNEGISTHHNPEFTMIEIYQAYADYTDMMALTEGIITESAKNVCDSLQIKYDNKDINLTPPWQRAPYLELFKKYCGVEWSDADGILKRAKQENIPVDKNKPIEAAANDLFEKLVEPNLLGPVFVTDYPKVICPLTKTKRDNPQLAERFELFINGMEVANAFTELNDPVDQRARFEKQLKDKSEEMVRIDEDFINALLHGMPPAGGLGIGIDRLVMILTDSKSIRDVILFPTLRPE